MTTSLQLNLNIPTTQDWHTEINQQLVAYGMNPAQATVWEDLFSKVGNTIMARVQEQFTRVTELLHIAGQEIDKKNPPIERHEEEIKALQKLVDTQGKLIEAYKAQIDALPASAGFPSRQPRIGEPPKYRGADDKVKLASWLNQLALWNAHEGIVTDKQRILNALTRLEGPAAQYMTPYFNKIRDDQDVGSWTDFVKEMTSIYGLRDEKAGAKKEIEALFSNKDLAQKDFIKYAEKFRTLARLTGHTDEFLVDKLRNIIHRDMKLVMAGKPEGDIPTKWVEYLEMLVSIFKILNPEKAQDSIFNTASGSKGGNSGNGGSTPMDIDQTNQEKKKKKKRKGCNYCGIPGHKEVDCRHKAAGLPPPDKKGQTQGAATTTTTTSATEKGKAADKPKKYKKVIRQVESLETDSEDEGTTTSSSGTSTQGAQKSQTNQRISSAHIEEFFDAEDVDDEDNPSATSGRSTPTEQAGFLKRYL